jgi:hypothetical protein
MRAFLRRGRTPAGMGLHPTTFEIAHLPRPDLAPPVNDLVPADSVRPDTSTNSVAASPICAAGRVPSRLAGPEQPRHVCSPRRCLTAALLSMHLPPTHARAALNCIVLAQALGRAVTPAPKFTKYVSARATCTTTISKSVLWRSAVCFAMMQCCRTAGVCKSAVGRTCARPDSRGFSCIVASSLFEPGVSGWEVGRDGGRSGNGPNGARPTPAQM